MDDPPADAQPVIAEPPSGAPPPENSNRRMVILLGSAIGALLVVAAVLLVLVLRSNNSTASNPVASASPSASATFLPIGTASPSASPTSGAVATSAPATSPPPPAPTPPPGDIVPPNGAFLTALPPPTTWSGSPPSADCHDLGDAPLWTITQCDKFSRPGGAATDVSAVVVEKAPDGAGFSWKVYVGHFSAGHGTWLLDLSWSSAVDGTANTSYVARDITGDGVPEIVVGYRQTGSGSILAYDVVDQLFTGVRVGAHRELSHGQAHVGANEITDWYAYYGPTDANCCPSYIQQSTVRWVTTAWRALLGPHVAADGAGDF